MIKLGAGTVGALANWSSSLNNFRMASAAGVTFDPSGKTITLTGNLIDETAVTGKLNLNGDGTLILGGGNTYTGGNSITKGTLQLNSATALGSTSGALTVNGGVLNLNGNSVTTGTLSGTGGTITDNSAGAGTTTYTVGQTAAAAFAGTINNGAAKTIALVKNGGNSLTLSGANTYSGGTTVNGGTLVISGSTGAGANTVAATATLAVSGAGVLPGSISVAPTGVFDVSAAASTFTLGSGQSLTVGGATPANDVVGNLATSTGSTLNIMSGVGTVGTLTSSGSFALNGGTVNFDLSNIANSGNDTVNIGGALDITGPTTIAINRISGSLANGSYVLVQGVGAVTGNVLDLTTTGLISGATRQTFALSTTTVTDALTLDVSGQAADLEWNNAALTGLWSTDVADENWNNLTAPDAQDKFFDGDNVKFPDIFGELTQIVTLVGTLTPATVTVDNTAAGTAYTLDGAGKITGATGFTKTGDGLLVLGNTGGNDYTGPTAINGGTVQISDAAAISQASALSVASGATLDVNGLNVTVPSLGGDGTALSNAGAGTLTVSTTGSVLVSALLQDGSGGLALTKAGAGTARLTNTNIYTGATTVTAGTLQVGDAGTTGSLGTAAVVNDATLAFNRTDAVTIANNVSGTGSVVQAGTGTTSITGDLTHTGGTTISAGTLSIGTGGTTGSVVGDIVDNGTLQFNRSDAIGVSSIISGSGAISQVGAGTTTLSGTNTFTGGVTVSAGVLSTSAAANLGSGSGAVALSNGAMLDVTGSYTIGRGISVGTGGGTVDVDPTFTLTRNGGFNGGNTLTKTGDGELRFQGYGGGTFSGAIVIDGGTVRFAGGAFNSNLGISSITVNSGTLLSPSGAYHSLGGYAAATPTLNINAGGNYTIGQEQYLNTINLNSGSVLAQVGGTNPQVRTDNSFQVNALTGASVWTANLTGVNQQLRFDVASGASLAFSGELQGGQALLKTGAGTMTLSGNNSYSGGSQANGGILEVSSVADAGGAGSIGPFTTGTAGYLGIANDGTFRYTGTGTQTTARNLWIDTGVQTKTIEVTSPTGDITFSGTAGNINKPFIKSGAGALTIADVINDGATVEVTGGKLTLSGANLYTGSTTVTAGRLHLTGSLTGAADVTGSLTGNGTVGGAATVNSGGAVAPGNGDVNTLTFTTSLTLASGSSYAVDITSAITNDKVVVGGGTGALTVDGAVAVTLTGYTPVAGDSFDVADGAISGTTTFDFTAATLGAGLAWDTTDFATLGVIKVVSTATDPYDTWAGPSGYNLTGGKFGDDDGDGVPNILEFATNADPTDPASGAKVFPWLYTDGGSTYLTYTVAVRKDAAFAVVDTTKQQADKDGVRYTVEATSDLSLWTAVVTELDETTSGLVQAAISPVLPGLGTDWTYHTFRTDDTTATDPQDFIHLKVEETPAP